MAGGRITAWGDAVNFWCLSVGTRGSGHLAGLRMRSQALVRSQGKVLDMILGYLSDPGCGICVFDFLRMSLAKC